MNKKPGSSARRLTEAEREKIADLCYAGLSQSQIAREIGAARSTVKDILDKMSLTASKHEYINKMSWSQEELDALVAMHAQKRTYKDIVSLEPFIGRRTIQAIKHKYMQLGLRMQAPVVQARNSIRIAPAPKPAPEPKPELELEPEPEQDAPEIGVHFFDLNERTQCRWPIARMRYCGRLRTPTDERGPYCEEHARIAMRPPKKDKQ